MKRLLVTLVSIAFVVLGASTRARADLPVPPGVAVIDDAGDAWLHDHCVYRGVRPVAAADVGAPGTIAALVQNVQRGLFSGGLVRSAKIFRCADKPPFWTASFTAAPTEAVTCAEKSDGYPCVLPLASTPAPSRPVDRRASRYPAGCFLPPPQPPASKVDVAAAARAVTTTSLSPTVAIAPRSATGAALAPSIPERCCGQSSAESGRRTDRRPRRAKPKA